MRHRRVGMLVPALLVVAGTAACGGANATTTAESTLLDHRWQVTDVRDGRGSWQLPPGLRAWIEFSADGELMAFDSVDRLSLRYEAAPGGFTPSGYRGSAGWTATRQQQRVAEAIAAVVGSRDEVSARPLRARGIAFVAGPVRIVATRAGA